MRQMLRVGVYWLLISAVNGDALTEIIGRIKAQLGQQMAMSLQQVGKINLQRL